MAKKIRIMGLRGPNGSKLAREWKAAAQNNKIRRQITYRELIEDRKKRTLRNIITTYCKRLLAMTQWLFLYALCVWTNLDKHILFLWLYVFRIETRLATSRSQETARASSGY